MIEPLFEHGVPMENGHPEMVIFIIYAGADLKWAIKSNTT